MLIFRTSPTDNFCFAGSNTTVEVVFLGAKMGQEPCADVERRHRAAYTASHWAGLDAFSAQSLPGTHEAL